LLADSLPPPPEDSLPSFFCLGFGTLLDLTIAGCCCALLLRDEARDEDRDDGDAAPRDDCVGWPPVVILNMELPL
jgi:hypothetical protein